MSDRVTSVEAAAEQLRQTIERGRESGITADAEAAQARDERTAREADPKTMLGREVLMLTGRMRWLARHPHVPRFLGGSAIKLRTSERSIETPLLFAADYDIGITEAYQCRTPVKVREGGTLDIEHFLVHTCTGRRKQIEYGSYHIYVPDIDSESPEVKVAGAAFRAYAENVEYGPDGLYWKAREFSEAHPVFGADTELRQWNTLLADTEEGVGWNYPPSLYLDPLGLVIQTNRALGTKRA